MAFTHGSLATFAIDPANGTSYTPIEAYLTDASPSTDIDTAETTTFGHTAKVYIAGLEDGSFSVSGLFDPTIHALLSPLKRVVFSFRYRPNGAGTGKAEATGHVLMTSYNIGSTVDGAVTLDADMQVSDGLVWAVQA